MPLIAILSLLIPDLDKYGPVPFPDPEEIRFTQLSLEEGLSQSSVFCMVQDGHGFLWFGTEDGLNRYDGYGFKVFKRERDRADSLSDNWIGALMVDRREYMWAATRKGVDRLQSDGESFRRYPLPEGDSEPWCLREDGRSRIWLGTDAGLFFLDGTDSELTAHSANALPAKPVRALETARNGDLWVGTWGGGLFHLEPDTGRTRHLPLTDQTGGARGLAYIRALLLDRQGRLWIGTNAGLVRYEPGTGSFRRWRADPSDPGGISHDWITALFEDRAGVLWIGTRGGGLNALLPHWPGFVKFRAEPGRPGSLGRDTVWSLMQDRSGVHWIGCGIGGGIQKWVMPRFDRYQHRPGSALSLSSNLVWSIHKDATGTLWVGTAKGLDRLDRGKKAAVHYRHDPKDPASLSGDSIWAIAEDRHGLLWLGTYAHGLNRFDPATGSAVRFRHDPAIPGSLSHDEIRDLHIDREGRLWIGTHGGGLNRFDADRMVFRSFRHDPADPQSLGDDRVWCIAEDGKGRLWLGTDGGGLRCLDPDRERFLDCLPKPGPPRGLGSDRIWSLFVDPQDRVWIGTKDDGINLLEPDGRVRRYNAESSPLPNNTVYAIQGDDFGRLWLSTNAGISRFDPGTGQFLNYDVAHGLQSREFNLGASHRAADGEMFFGGIQGLNAFHPKNLRENGTDTPLVVTGFSIFDRTETHRLPQTGPLELGHRENFFSFEFAALDFTSPRRNRYAFMLEGVDPSWRATDADHRVAGYTYVPPGSYTFRVRGSNGLGVWSEAEIAIPIRIAPPFHARWWFRFGLLAAAVAAGLAALSARRRRQHERNLRLWESRENERRRLADEIHDRPIQDILALRNRIDNLCHDSRQPFPAASMPALQGIMAGLTGVTESLRRTCGRLRSTALAEWGLEAAIHDHLARLARLPRAPRSRIRFEGDDRLLPRAMKQHFFRIFQKLVNNAVQHASAETIEIRFEVTDETARLEVRDDGRGFEAGSLLEIARRHHFGLLTARERAEAMGGRLYIQSRPGRGTVAGVEVRLGGRGFRRLLNFLDTPKGRSS